MIIFNIIDIALNKILLYFKCQILKNEINGNICILFPIILIFEKIKKIVIKLQKSFICIKLLNIFALFGYLINVYYNVLVQAIYFFVY